MNQSAGPNRCGVCVSISAALAAGKAREPLVRAMMASADLIRQESEDAVAALRSGAFAR